MRSLTFWKNSFFLAALLVPATQAYAISLQEALEYTYESNPGLQAERKGLAAIDEQMAQAVSEWRPSVSADYTTGRQRIAYGNARENYADKETRQLTVNQPLFNGGGSIARYGVAQANIDAGRARLEAAVHQTLLQAVTAYMSVLRDKEILHFSSDNVAILEKQKKANDERFALEEITRTDVAQSQARLARAKSDKIQAESNYAASSATFRRVIGLEPDILEIQDKAPELPATLQEALQKAEEINPALEQARHQARLREKEVDAEEAAILPRVSLQGTLRREEGVGGMFGSTDYDNDSLLLNVSVPLYQSGAEYSRVRQARQNRETARYEAIDTKQSTTERVSQAWEAVAANRAAIEAYHAAVEAAEEAVKGVKLEQLHGMRTVLDVLDAEQELFAGRLGLVRAEHDEIIAAYRLLAETGELTPERLGLEVDIYNPDENLERVQYRMAGY